MSSDNSPLQISPPGLGEVQNPNSSSLRIKIKNRRKCYLDRHPSYFLSPALELAGDPLLHDRLIRRFQTPSERATDSANKGYAGVLEADLLRSEAKMEALRKGSAKKSAHDTGIHMEGLEKKKGIGKRKAGAQGGNGWIFDDDMDESPKDKEEGMKMWKEKMERRFLAGADDDFEYDHVDAGEADDGMEEEREEQEKWFEEEEEEESWAVESEGKEEILGAERAKLKGETGVQDF